jgi:hypothetical protein
MEKITYIYLKLLELVEVKSSERFLPPKNINLRNSSLVFFNCGWWEGEE